MGRKKVYQQNLNAYVKSVSGKTIHSWLVGQARTRFGVALQEANLISDKAEAFLIYLKLKCWHPYLPIDK